MGGEEVEKNYFSIIKERMFEACCKANSQAKDHDVKRNHVNYGIATTYSRLLDDMGHDCEVLAYEENDCLVIAGYKLDGKRFDF